MGGCDGRMKSRNYYTEFAEALPKTLSSLTAGCAKYKFNKLNLGDINGIPRVPRWDSATTVIRFRRDCHAKLQEVFGLDDINKLPIIYNIAWYETESGHRVAGPAQPRREEHPPRPHAPAFLSADVAKNAGR